MYSEDFLVSGFANVFLRLDKDRNQIRPLQSELQLIKNPAPPIGQMSNFKQYGG